MGFPWAVLKLIELSRCFLEHSAVHHGVAAIYRLGFAACQLYRGPRECQKIKNASRPERSGRKLTDGFKKIRGTQYRNYQRLIEQAMREQVRVVYDRDQGIGVVP